MMMSCKFIFKSSAGGVVCMDWSVSVQGNTLSLSSLSSSQPTLNRTTLVLICEDGSLRIHLAGNSEAILHWLQPRYQPSTPLACLALHQNRRVSASKRKTEPPRFPIDFFEHCQRMGNSEMDVSLCMSPPLSLSLCSFHLSLALLCLYLFRFSFCQQPSCVIRWIF